MASLEDAEERKARPISDLASEDLVVRYRTSQLLPEVCFVTSYCSVEKYAYPLFTICNNLTEIRILSGMKTVHMAGSAAQTFYFLIV